MLKINLTNLNIVHLLCDVVLDHFLLRQFRTGSIPSSHTSITYFEDSFWFHPVSWKLRIRNPSESVPFLFWSFRDFFSFIGCRSFLLWSDPSERSIFYPSTTVINVWLFDFRSAALAVFRLSRYRNHEVGCVLSVFIFFILLLLLLVG